MKSVCTVKCLLFITELERDEILAEDSNTPVAYISPLSRDVTLTK